MTDPLYDLVIGNIERATSLIDHCLCLGEQLPIETGKDLSFIKEEVMDTSENIGFSADLPLIKDVKKQALINFSMKVWPNVGMKLKQVRESFTRKELLVGISKKMACFVEYIRVSRLTAIWLNKCLFPDLKEPIY